MAICVYNNLYLFYINCVYWGLLQVAQVKRIMISLPDYLLTEIDCIAAAEKQNRSEFVREAMKLYLAERRRRMLREQMKKGYVEMATINLALAIEQYRLESEVAPEFEDSVAGGKR
ncbi:transcriptional regulator, CopG family [Desulfallas thermosapovorans DSM 6562]|uniref:Transcriptional regulator, CopG family n=1 Tax=Desulfallas thermosapovorans DSM 6562 TaxID=1121431 RepID=A0A5S4ZVU7_9FIRM|nr:transcriptional regulator, CopG family [Desulfallas thermosapovorans DSM 6562]